MNLFKIIAEKCKIPNNKLELSAQSAYVLSVLNKPGEIDDVYEDFEKEVIEEINRAARFGKVELYIALPTYLIKEHKEKLFKTLENKGFTIAYKSYRSIIVNWEQL